MNLSSELIDLRHILEKSGVHLRKVIPRLNPV